MKASSSILFFAHSQNLLILLLLGSTASFQPASTHVAHSPSASSSPFQMVSTSSAARDLLYQDQQTAMERRATLEKDLLLTNQKNGCFEELKEPKLKIPAQKSGTGFSRSDSKSQSPLERLAKAQAKVIHKEGVLRINNALSKDTADQLREYVLEQQKIAAEITEKDLSLSKTFYGVENQRKNRCDLQLSLLKGGYTADSGYDNIDLSSLNEKSSSQSSQSHPLADALQELLGKDVGTLRYIYENLVTIIGEFYELASVITDPGSVRQQVHPDLPFKEIAPLYVIFLALQDVTEDMGPTTFLLRTHTQKENAKFNSGDKEVKDEQLMKAKCRLATLKKGDAVLFDARILHCGNENDIDNGSTRALFNFSFRNSKVKGDLGYAGSIRPGYVQAMNLGDISDALDEYQNGNEDPFAKYSDGI